MPDVAEGITPAIPPIYVTHLRDELQREFRGLHTKMSEIDALRHYEDPIQLPTGETPSGLEVRIGATSELIENIKASLTANQPNIVFTNLRTGDPATENSSNREAFWTQFLKWVQKFAPFLVEVVDAQAGLGIGASITVTRSYSANGEFTRRFFSFSYHVYTLRKGIMHPMSSVNQRWTVS